MYKAKLYDKKHIVFFISALRKGGAERVLINLAENFCQKGYKVTLVTQYKADVEYSIDERIKRIYSEISENEIGKNRACNFIKRYMKLRQIWKELKPDIIISFIGKNNLMAVLTTLYTNIPVVVSVRGDPYEEYYSKKMRLAAQIFFRYAAGVVLQTSDSRDFFAKKIQNKSVVLRNPLSKKFIRDRYTGEREKTIVSVGRLDENKNHQMLIRAFFEINQKYPDYRLIIYGEGNKRAELEKLIKELNLENAVQLPGNSDDIVNQIQKAGIFALTSKTEGMPNALLEAMVLGIPSISVNCPCGGPKELISSGENGYLIKCGDTNALVEKISSLIDNPELSKKIGEHATEIRNDYLPENVQKSWEEYINTIIRKNEKRG